MSIYIDMIAKAKEVEELERKLYIAKMELASAKMQVEYAEELNEMDMEIELSEYHKANKAKRGNRRRATKLAKKAKANLARSIYGGEYAYLIDYGMTDAEMLKSNHDWKASWRRIRKAESIDDCMYSID